MRSPTLWSSPTVKAWLTQNGAAPHGLGLKPLLLLLCLHLLLLRWAITSFQSCQPSLPTVLQVHVWRGSMHPIWLLQRRFLIQACWMRITPTPNWTVPPAMSHPWNTRSTTHPVCLSFSSFISSCKNTTPLIGQILSSLSKFKRWICKMKLSR